MLKATPCSQQKTIKNDKKTGVSENHAHNFTVKRMIIVLILPKVSLAFLLLAPLYLLYIYLVFFKVKFKLTLQKFSIFFFLLFSLQV